MKRWMLQPVRRCASGELPMSTFEVVLLVEVGILALAALVGLLRH